jgi:hypothetical protein
MQAEVKKKKCESRVGRSKYFIKASRTGKKRARAGSIVVFGVGMKGSRDTSRRMVGDLETWRHGERKVPRPVHPFDSIRARFTHLTNLELFTVWLLST